MPGRYRQRFHSGKSIQIISMIQSSIWKRRQSDHSETITSPVRFHLIISFHFTSGRQPCTDSNEEIFSNLYPIYLFNSPSRSNSPYNAKGISTALLRNFGVVESLVMTNSGILTPITYQHKYIYQTQGDDNNKDRLTNVNVKLSILTDGSS